MTYIGNKVIEDNGTIRNMTEQEEIEYNKSMADLNLSDLQKLERKHEEVKL